ncbi:manganese resistance protein MNR2 [Flagelloscypha sp. PMI_526]|nr:manganese resistance protein MNR2 [Flagelloscypha sp. PMI_526]
MASPIEIPVTSSPSGRLSHSDDGLNNPRHSPTLARPIDPNDPAYQERQRTMDVDMALHLSRARRPTISVGSPIMSGSPPQHLQVREMDHGMSSLSSKERYDLDLARGDIDEDALDLGDSPLEGLQDDRGERMLNHPGSSQMLMNMDIRGPQDPLLLVTNTSSLPAGAHPDHQAPPLDSHSPPISHLGLPTYQATTSNQQPHVATSHEHNHYPFNFDPMEEFGREEKATLGLNSPPGAAPRFSLSQITRKRQKATQSSDNVEGTSGDDDDTPTTPMPRARQRKLSHSNSPRHRKGIGGKLALFEAAGNTLDPMSSRLGSVLGTGLSSSPLGDDSGVLAPGPSTGILNTGHDRPYRFSFYSNALGATIHARSLSELPADGQSFADMFKGIAPAGKKPRPHSTYREGSTATGTNAPQPGYFPSPKPPSAMPGLTGAVDDDDSGAWWLDVTSPTDEEMKMLSKVFGIHPLTTEDILMEEAREKIELFRNYYLVCFRSFDQDPYSPTHLEPLNMYIIVFREGTLSFHFRPTTHPQNVRRRIKQLKDYISVTSDWISYALIDDITDAFGPLIQSIEYEVDSIDELVLILKEAEQSDMLRRIGTCRKKVMGLLRLMGNKADVVKGLAKRCNENWRVAPTSDIGLYLSDIQDHLITMTQNLNHYEKILSRSHSNYLAQISIEMTDANNQINDVLSKLTALGTVLIPMNLVTGLWGMNVHVPGQDVEQGYVWFGSIIACLVAFAALGGFLTYRFMVGR